MKHQELVNLVEIELTEEEEILGLWESWYPAEREDIKRGVAEYIEKRFRQVIGKKQAVERATGVRLRVCQPRTMIRFSQE